MSIRRANKTDVEPVVDLFSDTIQKINANDYSTQQIRVWSEARNLESWTAKIQQQHFVVKGMNGQIVGFSSIEPSGYIDFLYVAAQAQRKGIASELLQAILTQAQRQANERVWASVSETAYGFFKKMGFDEIEKEVKYVKGVMFENRIMQKKL